MRENSLKTNHNFMIRLKAGSKALLDWWTMATSQAVTGGSIMKAGGSGTMTIATSSDVNPTLLGVLEQTITSASTEYSTATDLPVIVPLADTEFIFDVGAGTLAATMEGNSYDLQDAVSVNVGGTTYKQVKVLKVLNTTGGSASLGQFIGRFNLN